MITVCGLEHLSYSHLTTGESNSLKERIQGTKNAGKKISKLWSWL